MIQRVFLVCSLLSATAILNGQTNARVQQGAFDVIGLSARTTNLDEAGPNGVISRFWRRLMSQKLLETIPDKLDSDVIAVYTEYASDENGAYIYLLGARVKPGTPAPEGMRLIHLPAATYLVFPTARGPIQRVVTATWQQIWKSFSSDASIQRAFKADFEVYGKTAEDPKNAQVEIYIGVQ